MNKWTIDKSFEFDYSHRVWAQDLNFELSQTTCNKCRFQHGHRGKVHVHLTSSVLDKRGMVMDFVELGFFSKFIDAKLDHKCILDYHDPSIAQFYPLIGKQQGGSMGFNKNLVWHEERFCTINPNIIKDEPNWSQEIYGSLVLVQFIPTSENLAKWFFDILEKKLDGYATVDKIEFFETPKSRSTYSR